MKASRASTLPELSSWQLGAVNRFARDHERARHSSFARLEAVDAIKAAKAALTPAQAAVLDLAAVRGRTLAQVAAATGRRLADLQDLMSSAATRLARHYETAAQE